MPPERIRDYEIIDGPFSGTYGQVCICRHVKTDWIRAVKRLHPHVTTDVIVEEARKQMEVKSPYVVQVLDLFDDNPPAILMEFCPTGLDQYLRDRFKATPAGLPFDEARELLHGILQGLNDAHRAGIVHGDIKPANVRFGADQNPKLGDFGAARRLRHETLTIKGSTNWMAPELLHGGDVTEESDYFSFGVLAYLVLSGRHPFFANDASCLTSEEDNIRSLTFRPVPLSALRQDVPGRVADLVMELLSRDKEARNKAQQALKAALAEALAPVELPQPSSAPADVGLSTTEVTNVDADYKRARELFFYHFRPREAGELLTARLTALNWQRFADSGLSKLAECWSLRGYINNSAGLFDEAVVAGTNGLLIYPDHVDSLHVRGYAYLQKGEYEKAEADLRNAYELTEDPRKRAQVSRLRDAIKARS